MTLLGRISGIETELGETVDRMKSLDESLTGTEQQILQVVFN